MSVSKEKRQLIKPQEFADDLNEVLSKDLTIVVSIQTKKGKRYVGNKEFAEKSGQTYLEKFIKLNYSKKNGLTITGIVDGKEKVIKNVHSILDRVGIFYRLKSNKWEVDRSGELKKKELPISKQAEAFKIASNQEGYPDNILVSRARDNDLRALTALSIRYLPKIEESIDHCLDGDINLYTLSEEETAEANVIMTDTIDIEVDVNAIRTKAFTAFEKAVLSKETDCNSLTELSYKLATKESVDAITDQIYKQAMSPS